MGGPSVWSVTLIQLSANASLRSDRRFRSASISGGGRFGGYGLYLSKGKPVFLWNLLDLRRVRWEGRRNCSRARIRSSPISKYDGLSFATLAFNNISGIGRPGTGTLKIDGKIVSTQTLDRTVPLTLPWDETFDIGSDTGTPVDDKDYQVPFRFIGKINKLTISLDRPKLTAEDEKRLMEAAGRAADGASSHLQRGPYKSNYSAQGACGCAGTELCLEVVQKIWRCTESAKPTPHTPSFCQVNSAP